MDDALGDAPIVAAGTRLGLRKHSIVAKSVFRSLYRPNSSHDEVEDEDEDDVSALDHDETF